MDEEQNRLYNFLKEVNNWVSAEFLLSVPFSQSALDSLVGYGFASQAKLSSSDLCYGLSVNFTDASNYIAISDQDWLKPSDNISLRVKVALSDFTTGSTQIILNKYNGYKLQINSSNQLELVIRGASSDITYTATSANTFTDKVPVWIRADWSSDINGLSQVDFKYSYDDISFSEDVEWVDIESKTATKHIVTHSTNSIYIGGTTAGSYAVGIYYAIEIWSDTSVRCLYTFIPSSGYWFTYDLLKDNYNNNLSIVGSSNFLLQNTTSDIYYKYNSPG